MNTYMTIKILAKRTKLVTLGSCKVLRYVHASNIWSSSSGLPPIALAEFSSYLPNFYPIALPEYLSSHLERRTVIVIRYIESICVNLYVRVFIYSLYF